MGCGCGGNKKNKNRRSTTVSRLQRSNRLRAKRRNITSLAKPTTAKKADEKERAQKLRQMAIRRALGHG